MLIQEVRHVRGSDGQVSRLMFLMQLATNPCHVQPSVSARLTHPQYCTGKKKIWSSFAPQGGNVTPRKWTTEHLQWLRFTAVYSSSVWRKLRLYWRACCSCTLALFSPPRKITDVTSCAFQMYANRIVSPVLGGECSSGGQEAVQVCTVKPEVVWLFIHKIKFTEQSVRSRAPHSHMKTLQQHPPYFKHYLSLP